MNAKFLMLCAALLCSGLVGCGKPTDKTDNKKSAKGDHDHEEGPHGGTIIELGKYHGEFCMDHAKKQATVYILDGKTATKATPIAVDKLLLSIKNPQFQVDLIAVPQDGDPAGKSSRFVATHDNFAKEQEFEGTVSGEIDGKAYFGDFKEEAHTDHKHDKDKKK